MGIPNLSNSMYVAKLRYIQSIHEDSESRNPDTAVRHFLPLLERIGLTWIRKDELARLREDPFYYYLVARTRYYDEVLIRAVERGAKRILSVGCGSDTRAHRFKDLLDKNGVQILECDQDKSIREKQRLVKRLGLLPFVQYLPIDLNDGRWPDLEKWLTEARSTVTLVLMEGVSPYVERSSHGKFVELIGSRLSAGSEFAYDFKIGGIDDSFGSEGGKRIPFRLPTIREEVAVYHSRRGLQLVAMELSSHLCSRLLPNLERAGAHFEEDGLIRLSIS